MTGKLISLRAPEPEDIDALFAWENDMADWRMSHTISPYSRFAIEQYVLNAHHDIFADKQLRLMISPVKTPDKPAGAIDLFDFDPLHQRAAVGIIVQKKDRRRGFAAEALQLLIQYSFNTLNLHQLYCQISADNPPSIHLFTKAGFKQTAIRKEWTWTRNGWIDEITMQLIKA